MHRKAHERPGPRAIRDGIRPSRQAILVFALFAATLAALFWMHRDLSLTLGNSEWDSIGQPFNQGVGTIDRTDTLRAAVRPDGLYGQGYAIATWAVRRACGVAGQDLDAFRAAQLVTCIASLFLVIAAWCLGRAFEVSPDLDWAPPLAVASAWPFLNIAAQVTTDVAASACVTFALISLFRAPTIRGGACAGLLLGVGFVVRGNVLWNFLPFMLIAALLPVTRIRYRARVQFALSLVAGFLVGGTPRFVSDWLQTGRPYYHEHAQILRAVLFDGGLEGVRPDPVGVFEVIRRDPALFARGFGASYSYYLGWLLVGLAVPFAVLLRDRPARPRAWVAVALLLGIPLGLATNPLHGSRYTLGLLGVSAVVWIRAVDRGVKGRPRRWAPILVAAALLPLHGFGLGLLLDKYRFDLPETEIVAAIGAATSAENGLTAVVPPLLLRPGVAFDQRIYLNAIRYRLRRLDTPLVDAPRPLDDAEVERLGVQGQYLVLRVPIHDTGPSVVWNRLRGAPREVHTPAPDLVLVGSGARRVVFDEVSGAELYLVSGSRRSF